MYLKFDFVNYVLYDGMPVLLLDICIHIFVICLLLINRIQKYKLIALYTRRPLLNFQLWNILPSIVHRKDSLYKKTYVLYNPIQIYQK